MRKQSHELLQSRNPNNSWTKERNYRIKLKNISIPRNVHRSSFMFHVSFFITHSFRWMDGWMDGLLMKIQRYNGLLKLMDENKRMRSLQNNCRHWCCIKWIFCFCFCFCFSCFFILKFSSFHKYTIFLCVNRRYDDIMLAFMLFDAFSYAHFSQANLKKERKHTHDRSWNESTLKMISIYCCFKLNAIRRHWYDCSYYIF